MNRYDRRVAFDWVADVLIQPPAVWKSKCQYDSTIALQLVRCLRYIRREHQSGLDGCQ